MEGYTRPGNDSTTFESRVIAAEHAYEAEQQAASRSLEERERNITGFVKRLLATVRVLSEAELRGVPHTICGVVASALFVKMVEIPLVVIVHFRDGKLADEHIYWDQASVLVQLGLLAQAGLPVAGIDTARKVRNPRLPSNGLIRKAGSGVQGAS